MPNHLRALVPILVAAQAAGCAPVSDDDRPQDIDESPRLELVEELRLGDFDDPDVGFTSIRLVAATPDGGALVHESGDGAIRVYSDEGALLRRIGGPGEGPGEFARVSRIGVVGDTVWAVDASLRRISRFLLDGSLLSARTYSDVSVRAGRGHVSMGPIGLDADGLFATWPTSIRYPREPIPFLGDATVPRVRFDTAGTIVDSAGLVPSTQPFIAEFDDPAREQRFIDIGGARRSVPRPPARYPAVEGLVDGHLEVERPWPEGGSGHFTVTRFGLAGDTVHHRVYTYAAQPYTDADLDAIALDAAPGGGGYLIDGVVTLEREAVDDAEVRRIAARIRDALEFPSHVPELESIRMTPSGRLWIARRGPAASETQAWLAFDLDGRLAGRVTLPASARVMDATDSHVWVRELDDFSVQWLLRYRIMG